MDQIAVETTRALVLADGATDQAAANARGHLFEEFVVQLLGTQGYSPPRRENLNVTAEGVELDVVANHAVTGHRLICECKAYSSNVATPSLTSFLGKLSLVQADDPSCRGLFIALPRLTPEAKEKADRAEEKLDGFRHLGSYDVCSLLADAKLLPSVENGPALQADPMLLITKHGLALAARELDPETRRAARIVVWNRAKVVPHPVLVLVERALADGLPVASMGAASNVLPVQTASPQPVVEVQGSSSDFEYQFPAAPAFFVGRKRVSQELTKSIRTATSGSAIVINAKSGWGKSSLALRLKLDVERTGGVALVVDTRTAERSDYVAAAMERLIITAVERDLMVLPHNAAFSSLASITETLRHVAWRQGRKPLLIMFDQFENVFRSPELTREFRDLALLVNDLEAPLTVGFSWKTDMVGWTEGYPYRLRDEIRDAATVHVLEPFGPRDVETLLRRLEKAIDAKLHRELRQRLREFSQGLPWLLKKLAGHILAEVEKGVGQEQLIRESLNVQGLFESDLSRLSPDEQLGLRTVAASAPVIASELDEDLIPSSVLDSLMHQRLVVQVGDRLDIYWDTFRDFLMTGRVAIEDSYVVRYAPNGPAKLLRAALAAEGNISVADAATRLNTTPTVIFNYSRELRLFGILSPEANRVAIRPELLQSNDREEAIRTTVAQAMRRHKMYSLLQRLAAQSGGDVNLADFASELPQQFPAIEAKSASWFSYARSFCQWTDYAGLLNLGRDGTLQLRDGGSPGKQRLLSGALPIRIKSAFPGSNPGPSMELLRYLADPVSFPRPKKRRFVDAVRDLSLLGVVEVADEDQVSLSDRELVQQGEVNAARLRQLVEEQRGMKEAFEVLEANPAATPLELGEALRISHSAEWAESTTKSAGKYIRGWARQCGIDTRLRKTEPKQDGEVAEEQPTLFDSVDPLYE